MPSLDDAQTLEFALGFILLLGVILYAVLGGADFGGGVWDLLARGPRANQQREVIAHAIGPIWEANHVWLIFVIVIVFTVFPPVYAALSVALFVPLTLALVGIVFRGVAFVFRTPGSQRGGHRRCLGSGLCYRQCRHPGLLRHGGGRGRFRSDSGDRWRGAK